MTGTRSPKLVLIGSWPRSTIEEAVTDMITYTDLAVSGGEVGTKWKDWIRGTALDIRRELGLKNRWRDEGGKYWHYFARVPRRAGSITAADLPTLGYAERAAEEWQVIKRLRTERGRDDLKFLVGFPTPFPMAIFSGPFFGNLDAFTEKLTEEVVKVCQIDGLQPEELVIQFELPAELITYLMVTPALRPWLGRWFKQSIEPLRDAAPTGVNFALHLCWGDLRGRALAPFSSMKAIVKLTNTLVAGWPQDKPLRYVHIPCGAGTRLPSLRKRRYRWLRKLRLPLNTLLVAGIIHSRQGDNRLNAVWGLVRRSYPGELAVSFPCGCGRHTLDEAIRGCEQRKLLTG